MYDNADIRSTPQYSNLKLFTRPTNKVLITDFFGSVRQTVVLKERVVKINVTEVVDEKREDLDDTVYRMVPPLPF